MWFEIGAEVNFSFNDGEVSVPLRGMWFEMMNDPPYKGEEYLVSVPLRGMWFEIALLVWLISNVRFRFPSPYGECGLK